MAENLENKRAQYYEIFHKINDIMVIVRELDKMRSLMIKILSEETVNLNNENLSEENKIEINNYKSLNTEEKTNMYVEKVKMLQNKLYEIQRLNKERNILIKIITNNFDNPCLDLDIEKTEEDNRKKGLDDTDF